MSKENPLVYLFSRTWKYSEGNRRTIVWFWIMFIITESTSLIVNPLLFANMINIVTKQGINSENIGTLLGLLALVLLAELFFWGLHGPARVMERNNAFMARVNYRKHLLKGVMTLPLEWHVDHHSGDTIDKIEKGTSALFSFSEDSFEIIYAIVRLIVSYAMLIYFSPSSSYIVFTMMLIMVWIVMRFDKVLITQYEEINHAENNISEEVFDKISNITTVIILRVERAIFDAIVLKVLKPFKVFDLNNRLNELKWFLTSLCCTITFIWVLGSYFWTNIGAAKGILVGSVYILINYLSKISEQFFAFTHFYGEVLQKKAKVMNAEELTKDFKPTNFTNHVLPEDWKQLEISGLNFTYKNGDGNIAHLHDVSMSLQRGEKVAVIGETGSGKTTFLQIMRDLYHPSGLRLAVDGQVIPAGFEGISQAIALVPQAPEIFASTIIENITLGTEHSMETIRHYTDLACFTDVAERLPNKFDTSIKERGVNLSGGERQRLALARGLLACRDKSLVLLDEPTSSVDFATDMKIYSGIFEEFEGKTIVSTVHHLHLLPLFDRIYMFNGGKIISSGTFAELLSQSPEFQGLWQRYIEHQKVEEVED